MRQQNNESAIKVAVSEDLEKMIAECEIFDNEQAMLVKGGKRPPYYYNRGCEQYNK